MELLQPAGISSCWISQQVDAPVRMRGQPSLSLRRVTAQLPIHAGDPARPRRGHCDHRRLHDALLLRDHGAVRGRALLRAMLVQTCL